MSGTHEKATFAKIAEGRCYSLRVLKFQHRKPSSTRFEVVVCVWLKDFPYNLVEFWKPFVTHANVEKVHLQTQRAHTKPTVSDTLGCLWRFKKTRCWFFFHKRCFNVPDSKSCSFFKFKISPCSKFALCAKQISSFPSNPGISDVPSGL